jgi:hypothetical protein
MHRHQPTPPTRPGSHGRPRRGSRALRWLLAAVALLLLGGSVLGGLHWLGVVDAGDWASASLAETRRRAHELTLALSENLPVYRVQLRTTTCNLPGAGTDNAVEVRLNPSNSTWLDYSHDDFERGASFTYDLGLENVDFLDDISMLELSKTGSDVWCLRRLELYVNNGLIFERSYAPSGRWLSSARRDHGALSIPGGQLRRNPNWAAYRPSLPPDRIARSEIESRIESAVGNALHGQKVTWRRLRGSALELARASRLSYSGELGLELKLDNWPDPQIDASFRLAISCREGRLTMRVRELRLDVDSPWYSDVATLGLLDGKIEQTLRQALRNVSLTRSTAVLICPPALGIASNGDLRLF